jgi:multiple sugar transport system substrate-binding protein
LDSQAVQAQPVRPNNQAANGKTKLTVSVWNYEGTPEFKALFDSYEAANPNVDIEPVDILADDYPQKVTTMLAGGDTTDVLTMKNVIDYSRYANNGQLQEINSVVDKVGKDNLAGIDAFNMDGKYFAALRTARTSGCCTTTRTCSRLPGSKTPRT